MNIIFSIHCLILQNYQLYHYRQNIMTKNMFKNRHKKQKRGRFYLTTSPFVIFTLQILHHSAHAGSTAHRHCRLVLGLVDDETFGRQEHAGD